MSSSYQRQNRLSQERERKFSSLHTSFEEISVKEVEQILKIEPKHRSSKNLERLDMFFSTNNFFIEHKKKLETKTINFLYRKICFQQCNKAGYLFKYGQMGRLFYIILDGEVLVKTPGPHILEGEENVNPKSVLLYLIKFYKDIDWVSLTNGELIHRVLKGEIENLDFEIDKDDNFDT